jgi:hypothetical protein
MSNEDVVNAAMARAHAWAQYAAEGAARAFARKDEDNEKATETGIRWSYFWRGLHRSVTDEDADGRKFVIPVDPQEEKRIAACQQVYAAAYTMAYEEAYAETYKGSRAG